MGCMIRTYILVITVGALSSLGAVPAQAATTYYACVTNATGAIRLVSSTATCKATEHKIQWNDPGPRGPAGPQGPPGTASGVFAVNNSLSITVTDQPTSIMQAQISQPGSYLFFATANLVNGDFDIMACSIVNVNSSGTATSSGTTDGQFSGVQYLNVAVSAAVASLQASDIPYTVELSCQIVGNASGNTIQATGASLSAIQVGTLQIDNPEKKH
ncbi:MAG: hypothetical protein WAN03_02560 [Candidatus Sulfotelmatobacter sp.]